MAFGDDRLRYAKRALDGIALGDCFGQTFFVPDEIACKRIRDREILEEPWYFTDDTVMAIGIYRILEKYGNINQDELAKVFAENYALDWHRGYGGTAHSILRNIGEGKDWREAAAEVFDGMGSMGNGAAMRVAPIGAYFADDLDKVLSHARASAEVTHGHREGIAGAMATAVASALLLNKKLGHYLGEGETFLRDITDKLPESDTKYKISIAASVPKGKRHRFCGFRAWKRDDADSAGYGAILPLVCGISLRFRGGSIVDCRLRFGRQGYHMCHCGRHGLSLCR